MSLQERLLAQVRAEIDAALAERTEPVVGDKDVTQLKRENTGLRNRVKELEERVKKIEDRLGPAAVAASAKTATAKGTTGL